MKRRMAVIGVGNMAKAIIAGLATAELDVSEVSFYDTNPTQYDGIPSRSSFLSRRADSIEDAVLNADVVLLSVKPQNYTDVLKDIALVEGHAEKLYISIAAGITVASVSEQLNGACVIRVLPNVPMLIGKGVSVICRNKRASDADFSFVCDLFQCAGGVLVIEEEEMNRTICTTSSSPAYVFQFINAIYKGALNQDLPDRDLLRVICDVVIGSAEMLKQSDKTPEELMAMVASKGGTTERALLSLRENNFDDIVSRAMLACTKRADELGEISKK